MITNTKRVNVSMEAGHARGMVERRQELVKKIGLEESRWEALHAYTELAGCVREVAKHHNNIVSVVDDASAGYALETSLLLDNSRKWLAQSELACRALGVTDTEITNIKTQMGV